MNFAHACAPLAAIAALFVVGCSAAPSGDDQTEDALRRRKAPSTSTPTVDPSLLTPSRKLATAFQVNTSASERDGDLFRSVSVFMDARAVALRGSELASTPAPAPATVRVDYQTIRVSDYQTVSETKLVDATDASVEATADGFVVHAAGVVVHVRGNRVSIDGAGIPSGYPSLADVDTNVITQAYGTTTLPLTYGEMAADHRDDHTGRWQGSIKELDVGAIRLHCSLSSRGSDECDVQVTGAIVARSGEKNVVEAVVEGAGAAQLFAALPGSGTAPRATGSLICGYVDGQARCIARANQL